MPKMDFAAFGSVGSSTDFELAEMRFGEMKIGDTALSAKPVEPNVLPAIRSEFAVPPHRVAPPLKPLRDLRRS